MTKYAVIYKSHRDDTLYADFRTIDKALADVVEEAEVGDHFTIYEIKPVKKGRTSLEVKKLKTIKRKHG